MSGLDETNTHIVKNIYNYISFFKMCLKVLSIEFIIGKKKVQKSLGVKKIVVKKIYFICVSELIVFF